MCAADSAAPQDSSGTTQYLCWMPAAHHATQSFAGARARAGGVAGPPACCALLTCCCRAPCCCESADGLRPWSSIVIVSFTAAPQAAMHAAVVACARSAHEQQRHSTATRMQLLVCSRPLIHVHNLNYHTTNNNCGLSARTWGSQLSNNTGCHFGAVVTNRAAQTYLPIHTTTTPPAGRTPFSDLRPTRSHGCL